MKKEKVLKKINPLFLKGICHRGLHNDKFIENGMLAFKNALDNNMALELDIHLTKDNEFIKTKKVNDLLLYLQKTDNLILQYNSN